MLELRNINPDEFERWMRTESRARGNRLNHDPEELRPHFDLSRSIAVFEDGQTGGGVHSHWLEMPIPGGTSVGAGVSKVEVQTTHTRRGIMAQMMLHQIDGIHDRGEPLAALFVTESAIYSRFGFSIGSSVGPGKPSSVAPWPDCEPCHSQPDCRSATDPTSPPTRARSANERLLLHAALAISPSAATAGHHRRVCVAISRSPHPHLLESGLDRSPSFTHQPLCQRQHPSLRWIRV